MHHRQYDAIIIGAGLGGLICGNYLAQAGLKTLILEQHGSAGGYCTSFKRRNFIFDTAVHFLPGLNPNGQFSHILQDIGVHKKTVLYPLDPLYKLYLGDASYSIPAQMDAYIDLLIRLFPHEQKGIRDFFNLVAALAHEYKTMFFSNKFEMIHFSKKFPNLYRYLKYNFQDMVKEFIRTPKLISILGSGWPFVGLPKEKISAIKMVGYLNFTHQEGSFYPKGGIQSFADRLVNHFKKNNGEIILNAKASKIITEKNQAIGVELENKNRIFAKKIVSNIDARQTFCQLINPDLLPKKFVKHLNEMLPSIAFFQVWLALDTDVRQEGFNEHEILLYENENLQQPCAVCIPTLSDPSLAPKGTSILCITYPFDYDAFDQSDNAAYKRQKADIARKLIQYVENKLFPSLSKKIIFSESASPLTYERYTLNRKGAAYGWAPLPDYFGRKDLKRQTPIESLYLAGHWSLATGGGSTLSVALSAKITAKHIIDQMNSDVA